jgi:small nuclear ribonucleoprotein (snRNP)-like protein
MTTVNNYDFFHIYDKVGFAIHINEKVLFLERDFNKDVTLMNSYFDKKVPDVVDENAVVEIINDNFKGLIQIPDSYFHYFSDFIGPIFVFLENCIKGNIKKVELILIELEEKQPIVKEFDSFLNHCLDTFRDRLEVSYVIVNQANKAKHLTETYLRVNNSCVIGQQDIGISMDFLYESAKSFSNVSDDSISNKKVFLSRKNDVHKDKAANRHIYEDDAEIFFKSIGFEIVNGESFGSLKKQIEFFDQVSVLAGYTGSGLTSSIFMKPGQTLIEVVCPIKFGVCGHDGGDEWEIHNFYKTFSVLKNHTYIAVPNVDRSKESFLKDLKKVSRMF